MGMVPQITVVEDEEALSVLLRYNLEAEGYEVDTILRGDEAEVRLQERVPDLLILDWMLPGLSGIELCRRLRVRPETERLPIILLTARGEESERVRGLSTGADDYVVKPFSTPELMARVRALKSSSYRRNSACWNFSWPRRRGSLRDHNCWTAFGGMTSMSMNARLMCMSVGCARPSIWPICAMSSAQYAVRAIRSKAERHALFDWWPVSGPASRHPH